MAYRTLEEVIADTRREDEPNNLVNAKKILIEAIQTNRAKNREFGVYGLDEAANFVQNIRGKDRVTLYKDAIKLLDFVKGLKVSEGGTDYTPHYADEAEFLSKYATLRSQLVYKKFTAAFATLADTIAFLDARMDHRKDLKASLVIDQARAFMGAGVYGRALDILENDVDEAVSRGEKSFLRGEILFRQGKYVDSAEAFKQSYAANPGRSSIKDSLVRVYLKLEETTPNPTENYSGIDNKLREAFKEGSRLYLQGQIRNAQKKFDEVVTGLGATPTADAEKAMKARALQYIAMVERQLGDHKSAIQTLYQSLAVIQTPNAFRNLAETYKLAK